MPSRTRSLGLLIACVAVVAVGASAQDYSRGDAASMEKKILAIAMRGEAKAPAANRSLKTSFTEREVNAYLKFSGSDLLPTGVVSPQITISGERRVSARAIVDLDAVRKSKERGWFDPASYLTGSVEVRATGLLQTANGVGTLHIESATVGGVPVPKSLLQELVSYYSRTPDTPAGFDLDKPFELPANIREVEIQRGAATVIQ